ncbi:MAG: hypothetical protein A3B68_05440 [Candidatus Melainabacteria bacterium RIFCSPHIGHO2_02_FULL_34_12]|nr:MAG: hypothetical protein A3B68_05440 [Candidatus Melainabacteria bacterium RIFCSPHIGHO2_02_FULL_34_12]
MDNRGKAVFLDRDGVINYPVFNPNTNEYEAPYNEKDLKLFPGVIESLKKLLTLNYKLFLISNQPDYAKGKTTLENLNVVHQRLHSILLENNIKFDEYYYCYHHPQGKVAEYTVSCECRKPGNFFLKKAKLTFGLDLSKSWMIGDRDSDIYCGQSMELKTIQVMQQIPDNKAGHSKPDFKATGLKEAVIIIGKNS